MKAGGDVNLVRSLCYDMGHIFEDESELAGTPHAGRLPFRTATFWLDRDSPYERELARLGGQTPLVIGCIADMRAIGEGEVTEHAFVKVRPRPRRSRALSVSYREYSQNIFKN